MTFNGKDNQPRKRSTNLRSLNNRLNTLQRETNPRVTLSGTHVQVGSTKTYWMYVRRKVNSTFSLVANELKVTPSLLTNTMPDGAKVLKVKVVGRDCRNVRVRVPKGTKLFSRGPNNDEEQDNNSEVWAPLSRFPSLTLDVPDTLSNAVDTNDTNSELFTVFSKDNATAVVTLTLTYLTMV